MDKRCGEIMKNAEDFAVMIRKQLKKEIVKIPKKVRPRRPNPATTIHRTLQLRHPET